MCPGNTKYPSNIRKLQSRKLIAWTLYRTHHSKANLIRFKKVASECRNSIYRYHCCKEEKLITTGNIGNFYRYANAHLKSRSNVGPLKSNDGSLTFDPLCKANMLSAYFSSVYTVDNHSLPPHHQNVTPFTLDLMFTPNIVLRKLIKLNTKAEGGPDGVPPIFLKLTSFLTH